jgi:hypothetical protein
MIRINGNTATFTLADMWTTEMFNILEQLQAQVNGWA